MGGQASTLVIPTTNPRVHIPVERGISTLLVIVHAVLQWGVFLGVVNLWGGRKGLTACS